MDLVSFVYRKKDSYLPILNSKCLKDLPSDMFVNYHILSMIGNGQDVLLFTLTYNLFFDIVFGTAFR